ncbi:hypothetical protein BP00DRAFT_426530, partial [Aspergillus indologenus CBS 114.80]
MHFFLFSSSSSPHKAEPQSNPLSRWTGLGWLAGLSASVSAHVLNACCCSSALLTLVIRFSYFLVSLRHQWWWSETRNSPPSRSCLRLLLLPTTQPTFPPTSKNSPPRHLEPPSFSFIPNDPPLTTHLNSPPSHTLLQTSLVPSLSDAFPPASSRGIGWESIGIKTDVTDRV